MQTEVMPTTNILFVGIGGQGTILASEITCAVLCHCGYDVKKSEIHGMSQRGGSVRSDIRFGSKVYSPLIPDGYTDFLVAFHPNEQKRYCSFLKPGGTQIEVIENDIAYIPHEKVRNTFLLGKLSIHLPVDKSIWKKILTDMMPESYREYNLQAFANGIEQELKKINKR